MNLPMPKPGRPVGSHRASPGYGWEPKTFRWWYDAIIDWMITNPQGSLKACAEELGRSPQSIRMIVASDMFKARWSERRGLLSQSLNDAITARTGRVAIEALDVLEDRLKNKPQSIPSAVVNDIAVRSMEALGFGAKPAGKAVPTTEVHLHVDRDILVSAREKMRTIEGQLLNESPQITVQPVEDDN
jgi:hypothetical protein